MEDQKINGKTKSEFEEEKSKRIDELFDKLMGKSPVTLSDDSLKVLKGFYATGFADGMLEASNEIKQIFDGIKSGK